MSADAGQAGRGGGEEGPEGEGEGGNVIMTSEMLRKRVVTLCNAGDYGLALEVARLAQRKGAVPGGGAGGAGESDASGDAPTGGANDVMLAEIIALLEEKARFAAEDDEDDSDTDGADDDDGDDDDEDEDDDDDDDDDESSESDEDGNEAAG